MILGVRDTQNFIHDKYRDKTSRYSMYLDTRFENIKKHITLRKGQGVTCSMTDTVR